jgi:predicted nuclease with TOPRIM domain
MLPKDQADGSSDNNELILDLQERLIRAETQEEELRANLIQMNGKLRETINELERIRVENMGLQEK